jgi:hypothetical protein
MFLHKATVKKYFLTAFLFNPNQIEHPINFSHILPKDVDNSPLQQILPFSYIRSNKNG